MNQFALMRPHPRPGLPKIGVFLGETDICGMRHVCSIICFVSRAKSSMEDVRMESNAFKSPVKRLVRFCEKSRDGWKAKHHALKQQLKKSRNQVRAVEKSRARWREVAQQERRRVRELSRELEEQKDRNACPGRGKMSSESDRRITIIATV